MSVSALEEEAKYSSLAGFVCVRACLNIEGTFSSGELWILKEKQGALWKLENAASVPDLGLDPLPPVPSLSFWVGHLDGICVSCPFTNLCLSHSLSLSLSMGAHRESSFPGSAQTFIGPEKEVGGGNGMFGVETGGEKGGKNWGRGLLTMTV